MKSELKSAGMVRTIAALQEERDALLKALEDKDLEAKAIWEELAALKAENKRLRETIADFLSDTNWSLISPELLDRARKQALKGGK